MRRVFLALAIVSLSSGSAWAECRTKCKEGEVPNVYGCCIPKPKHIILPGIDDVTPKATPHVASPTVVNAEFSRDGMRVVSVEEKVARVRDAGTGSLLMELPHKSHVTDATFSPDGKQIATTDYGRLSLWDGRTGKLQFEVDAETSRIHDVEFSPDGLLVMTGAMGVKAWDARNGTLLYALEGIHETIADITFSRDGRYVATATADKRARMWDTKSGKLIRTFTHDHPVRRVEFSTRGGSLATAAGKTAKVWQTTTGKLLHTFGGHSGEVTAAVFDPDSRHLITACRDKTGTIWNLKTGKARVKLLTSGAVRDIDFSPDGSRMVTASGEAVQIWDLETGRHALTLKQPNGVSRARFSSDGEWIMAAGGDKPHMIELPRKP